ncbi:HVO_A0114 family putative DNA-binding protein [Halorussus halophilus]|uniref:HVO_A0114 family putative DNA-binding protein n=1 Tax=Halorussus halophilus TaxID=2650975 RepID=UPI001301518C|nr:MarR family transcriptional regulator [Halorussus halophilus]
MTENTLTIRVEPASQFFDDVEEDFRRLDEGDIDDIEQKNTLSVPDEEALARVLSAKNVELLRTISTREPSSVRELARFVDRDIKNVSSALSELEALGVVEFEQDGRAKRPVVWYGEIDVKLTLDGDDDTDPVEAAG